MERNVCETVTRQSGQSKDAERTSVSFGRRPVSSIPSFIRVELCFSESPPTPSSSLVAVSFHKLQDVGEQSFGKSSRKFLLQGR